MRVANGAGTAGALLQSLLSSSKTARDNLTEHFFLSDIFLGFSAEFPLTFGAVEFLVRGNNLI